MIPIEWMPPLMFGGLVLFMLVGYPVAFSLAALGLTFGFIAMHEGFFTLDFLQAIPSRVFGNVLSNEPLLAILFFTFMGSVLERCGLAGGHAHLDGPAVWSDTRGGPRLLVILVGFHFGAITGTVAAQVIAMALISMPVMMRYGYNMRYTTGVLARPAPSPSSFRPRWSSSCSPTSSANRWAHVSRRLGAVGLPDRPVRHYTFCSASSSRTTFRRIPKEARTLTGWALWKKCLMGIIPSAVR